MIQVLILLCMRPWLYLDGFERFRLMAARVRELITRYCMYIVHTVKKLFLKMARVLSQLSSLLRV